MDWESQHPWSTEGQEQPESYPDDDPATYVDPQALMGEATPHPGASAAMMMTAPSASPSTVHYPSHFQAPAATVDNTDTGHTYQQTWGSEDTQWISTVQPPGSADTFPNWQGLGGAGFDTGNPYSLSGLIPNHPAQDPFAFAMTDRSNPEAGGQSHPSMGADIVPHPAASQTAQHNQGGRRQSSKAARAQSARQAGGKAQDSRVSKQNPLPELAPRASSVSSIAAGDTPSTSMRSTDGLTSRNSSGPSRKPKPAGFVRLIPETSRMTGANSTAGNAATLAPLQTSSQSLSQEVDRGTIYPEVTLTREEWLKAVEGKCREVWSKNSIYQTVESCEPIMRSRTRESIEEHFKKELEKGWKTVLEAISEYEETGQSHQNLFFEVWALKALTRENARYHGSYNCTIRESEQRGSTPWVKAVSHASTLPVVDIAHHKAFPDWNATTIRGRDGKVRKKEP